MRRFLKRKEQSDEAQLGAYRLLEKLGEGGMGVVWVAQDPRLSRRVAIKRLRPQAADQVSSERLWREARAAAAVSHPNVCQIYEVGGSAEDPYIVMELLEGEVLAARIARGALPVPEAVRIVLEILAGLAAVHERGLIHRDLKPANVFLTPHGVKLLDFGLARGHELSSNPLDRLTATGMIAGTPGFMAPEQISGGEVGRPADLFAVGAILFEMLCGRPAFSGATPIDVCHAVLRNQPPALSGGAGIEAIDLVIQRALAKDPVERPPSAQAMAAELTAASAGASTTQTAEVRTMSRLLVLPLRVLKPDADAEVLSFALADAIVESLQSTPSLVVRSSHVARLFAGAEPDLAAIARDACVDLVLLGTLIKAGDRVRVSAQLLEAPAGGLVRSESVEVAGNDLFRLQDELAQRISSALSGPLQARSGSEPRRDIPASPLAYELYLRATQLSTNRALLGDALELYRACLREDPKFAPAWARVGRIHRVLAKYGLGDSADNLPRAEEALRRALELNPELGIAHMQFAHFEIEEQGKSVEAMERLIPLARRNPSDPDFHGGLVLACRFCGLLEASLAADRKARRLDPGSRTSVAYTWWMLGDYERSVLHDDQDWRWLRMYALPMLGREAEGVAVCDDALTRGLAEGESMVVRAQRAAILGDRETCEAGFTAIRGSGFHDPEGIYFAVRALARVGSTEAALDLLAYVVGKGYACGRGLAKDPWFDSIRADERFIGLIRKAEERRLAAEAVFLRAGGEALLGISLPTQISS